MYLDKKEIIKQREGERLARYLRVLFGVQPFDFHWIDKGTSFTDGKDVYCLYPFINPKTGDLFEPVEQRVLRKATGIHERGHIEYDVLQDYMDWLETHSSCDYNDWMSNKAYPASWLRFFGNVMIDGRMEHFTVSEHPSVQEYFDFKNYHWKVPETDQLGTNQVEDFRFLFFRRAMGMSHTVQLLDEAVKLVDSVQHHIDKARIAESTAICLDHTLDLIRDVWPVLVDWMNLEDQSPEDFEYEDDHLSNHDTSWGDPEEVKQNVKKVMLLIEQSSSDSNKEWENNDSDLSSSPKEDDSSEKDESEEEYAQNNNKSMDEDDVSSSSDNSSNVESSDEELQEDHNSPSGQKKSDSSKAFAVEQRALEEDEREAEVQINVYGERHEEVTVWEHREDRPAYSEKITIKPYGKRNVARYQNTLTSIKRQITSTARALNQLLQPAQDEVRHNQRSGRLKANRAWRAEALKDPGVFIKRKKGTPAKHARALLLNDISGSTLAEIPGRNIQIIDEMRKAQVLVVEACERAHLPIATYGFTEDVDETVIFPLKPFGRFSALEKSFIGGISPEWGNRDTLALQWAVDQLVAYPEEIKLLFMLSDGEPCFSKGEDYNTMRSIVLQAEKRGVDVLCLYIGPQHQEVLDRVRYMYPGRSIIVSNNLARELQRHMKRLIRKRLQG